MKNDENPLILEPTEVEDDIASILEEELSLEEEQFINIE